MMKELVAKKPFIHWFAPDECVEIKRGQLLNISEEFEDFYVININNDYFIKNRKFTKKLKDLEEGKF